MPTPHQLVAFYRFVLTAPLNNVELLPGERGPRLTRDAVMERRSLPQIGARGARRGRRSGVAHEALQRGDDSGRLFGVGIGGDDLELGTAIHDGPRVSCRARGATAHP